MNSFAGRDISAVATGASGWQAVMKIGVAANSKTFAKLHMVLILGKWKIQTIIFTNNTKSIVIIKAIFLKFTIIE